jgi:guanosine-3',5'-bis(diphosphate) 3'-pyrophosphohydrolase
MSEMTLLERAYLCASEHHGDQRYGYIPYTTHLCHVVGVLLAHGYTDRELLAIAYLHDVLEDTTCHYSDLEKQFGQRVAEGVFALTDELGRNRRERHEKTYPKLVKSSDAVLVKLADRIANVSHSAIEKPALRKMYAKEYEEFKRKLFCDRHGEDLWKTLDDILLPKPPF